jgi:hypothetical protein
MSQHEAPGVSACGLIHSLLFPGKQLRQTGIALDVVLAENGFVGGQTV